MSTGGEMAKTKREHREAALAAWNGPNPPRAVLAVNAVIQPWIEIGEPFRDGAPMCSLTATLQRIAEGYAAAEQAGIRASLEVVVAKQLEWHELHSSAVVCVADGSVEPGSRDVIAAAGNALYDACERINALLAKP